MKNATSNPRHWSSIIFWTIFGILALLPSIVHVIHASDPNPAAGAAAGFFGIAILIVGAVLWACFGSPAPQAAAKLCTQCCTRAMPTYFDSGSGLLELFLFCVLLIPGIFYHLWRRSHQYWGCPACKSHDIIPLDSPAAIARLQATKQEVIP